MTPNTIDSLTTTILTPRLESPKCMGCTRVGLERVVHIRINRGHNWVDFCADCLMDAYEKLSEGTALAPLAAKRTIGGLP